MKIVLVHISDIHLKEAPASNPILSRADQMAAAAASVAPEATRGFLVVTGDITQSGKESEVSLARTFLSGLREQLCRRLPDCPWSIVAVPGNHDCDMQEAGALRDTVLRGLSPSSALDERVLSNCTVVQRHYKALMEELTDPAAERQLLSAVYDTQVHRFSEHAVEFRAMNSAWMSTDKESHGTLLFPVQLLQAPEHASAGADLVVALLHHPFSWFEPANGRELRSILEKTSDIILTGHEHEPDRYSKSRDLQRLEYVEGGILQNHSSPYGSSFNTILIDLPKDTQEVRTFQWSKRNRYEPDSTATRVPFVRNRYRLRNEFLLKDPFVELLDDPGARFYHPGKEPVLLSDLYVYPDLRRLGIPGEDQGLGQLVQDEVAAFVADERTVLLVGPERCGKTVLSKVLFRDLLNAGYVPILASGSDFKHYKADSVVPVTERRFGEAYQSPDLTTFWQLDGDRRAVIVDDFDQCTPSMSARDRIIQDLQNRFGIVVLLGNEQVRYEELITGGADEIALLGFTHCDILPFGHMLRAQLIHNWCFLGRDLTHDASQLTRRAREVERTVKSLLGSGLIPSHPIFILIVLQQLESVSAHEMASSSGSHGFLYECLITSALAASSRLTVDLGTQYTYLTELARVLFTREVRSLTLDEAYDWHKHHCVEYGLRLDWQRTLDDLQKALVIEVRSGQVSFRYPYFYYYFVARYMRDRINSKEIRDRVEWMSKRLHHAEYANIIVFLTYLCREPYILSLVLDSAKSLFSPYEECDLADSTSFLQSISANVPQLVLDARDPEEHRREILAHQDRVEPERAKHEAAIGAGTEATATHDDLDEVLRLNVAFKTIQILGQILRNYAGSLRADEKLELAAECYALALRTLEFMVGSIEANKQELVLYLDEFLRLHHRDWSDRRVADKTQDFVFSLVEGLCFATTKHVSGWVGLHTLAMTYDQLLEQADTVSHRFIDLSVRLDYYPTFPETEVHQLAKAVQRHPFPTRLLQRLVWNDFYMTRRSFPLKQSMCAKLGIKLEPALIHAQRLPRRGGT